MHVEETSPKIPKAFLNRRMHSFLGIWLVLYLIEHLLTNSEAALFVGADGEGFIKMVNFIHSLPYLYFIEITLIAIPFLIHIVLGVKYLFTMEQNSYGKNLTKPYLPEYSRNHAYTWQRITSWLLILFVLLHVGQMRFMKYPKTVKVGDESFHMVKVEEDSGLATLSERLGIQIFDKSKIGSIRSNFDQEMKRGFQETKEGIISLFSFQESRENSSLIKQKFDQKENFLQTLEGFQLGTREAVAVANSMGSAILMNVRETFKSPLMLILYTIFVLFAVFHGANGVWTFAITWGIPLSMRGQNIVKQMALVFMALLLFLGLAAVWGSYWINLRD